MATDRDPITHYIIVRRDLPTGTICAQIAHAAGESFKRPPNDHDDPEPITVVVLAAKSETHLLALARRLRRAKAYPHRVICEPDPPHYGNLMAIGIQPARKSKLYHLTKGYNLLRFE
jgi:peptidyl-tRNA hydrolase